jgi:predicted O-methyltransferase YrrM
LEKEQGMTDKEIEEKLDTLLFGVTALISGDEKIYLYKLAIANGKKNILEIGSHHGGSSICLATGMSMEGNLLYCIDTWPGESMIRFHEGVLAAKVYNRICPIRQDANLILRHVSIKNVGLVFIDSGHSYEDNALQVECCMRFTEKGCVYAFHDYDNNGGDVGFPGVNKYCDELIDSGKFKKINIVGSIFSMEQL